MLNYNVTFIGIDAHKEEHKICLLYPDGQESETLTVKNHPTEIKRMLKKIKKKVPGEVMCCYEAGPCGFALQRQIQAEGVSCIVVAPSLIPVKPGERVKTDRRDAKKLAELFRAGLLTEVHPPTPAEEAIRDLCRCRGAAKKAETRAKHQLVKFLLRRGRIYREGPAWTQKFGRWLDQQTFEEDLDRQVFEEYRKEVGHQSERVKRLDRALEEAAQAEPYATPVRWLCCFRGIEVVTAMVIVSELYGFARFGSARELMAFLGMVPSENSSGERQNRGAITKTGNERVRRILVEAAWHNQHPPRVGQRLAKRRQGQPDWVIRIADEAMRRLYKRYGALIRRGKPGPVAVMAVARELAGFVWAVLHAQTETAVEKKAA